MSASPLISIIIPSYNSLHFLPRSIGSVFAQSFSDYEIIVVDDGSTDGTKSSMSKLFGSAVRYHYQANKGLAGARNTGLQLARGTYIQFLDADDTISPDKLEKQAIFLNQNEDVDAVFSDYIVVDANGQLMVEATNRLTMSGLEGKDVLGCLAREGFFVVHCLLTRKSALEAEGGFDENSQCFEDWDLWLRMLINGRRFRYLPGISAQYYKHGTAMTDNHSLLVEGRKWMLEKFSENSKFRQMNEMFGLFQSYQNRSIGDFYYNRRDWSTARKYYFESLKCDRIVSSGSKTGVVWLKAIAHQLLSRG